MQTPDTDLNQHVKREYTSVETGELLRQINNGICVPTLRQEQCIDIMVGVLENIELHLKAADGFLKTGLAVALDGSQDQLIVREANIFGQSRGCGPK